MKPSEVLMVRGTTEIKLFSPYLDARPDPGWCWSIRHPGEEEDQSEHEPHIPLRQVFLAGGVLCLSLPSPMTSSYRSSCPSPRLKAKVRSRVFTLWGKRQEVHSTLRPKPFSRPAINRIYVRGFAQLLTKSFCLSFGVPSQRPCSSVSLWKGAGGGGWGTLNLDYCSVAGAAALSMKHLECASALLFILFSFLKTTLDSYCP